MSRSAPTSPNRKTSARRTLLLHTVTKYVMDGRDKSNNAEVIELSSPTQFSSTELLWNQFLMHLTERPSTSTNMRKYPNPDVPEFYPRSMRIVCQKSHETGDSSANERTHPAKCTDLNLVNKNDIFLARVSAQCLGAQPTLVQTPETVGGVTHYYWSYHDPHTSFKGQTRTIKILQTDATSEQRTPPVMSEEASTSGTLQELRLQLQIRNQQLVHMNNVVKALLEEIYKINELLTRYRIREQESIDVHSSTEQYLNMVRELGYSCVDCCSKLKEFVSHLSKQLERKILKQHGQSTNNFVDCILLVIENSLRALTRCPTEEKPKPVDRRDACTQTSSDSLTSSRLDSRPNKQQRKQQQVTKVYRNRNYYKYDAESVAPVNSNWTRAIPRASVARGKASTGTRIASSSTDAESSKNPIQLVHQRFKNLNCRLEGIPERKLVKFSYIVDNKEYSAIAKTKKEAQYLCAWHMLNSCSE